MPRFGREILLSLLIVGGLACNDGDGPTAPAPVVAVASLEVSPASSSVLEGETVTFRAVAKNAQGEEIQAAGLTWRSADPLIAQVNRSGVAVARPQSGTTEIIAEIGGKRASAALTSQARCASPAPVHGTRDPALSGVIVKVRDGLNAERLARNLAQKYGFEPDHIYGTLPGFSAVLTDTHVAQIRCEREVERLEFEFLIPLS
jgi:hypothetical protein